MAEFSVFDNGGWVSAAATSGTISVPYPSSASNGGASAEDLLYLAVHSKPDTGTITTPGSWTLIDSITGGAGAVGASTGPTRIDMYKRTVPGGGLSGSLSVTISGSNIVQAIMFQVRPDSAGTPTWSETLVGGQRITNSTDLAVTATENQTIADDDIVVVVVGTPDDGGTDTITGVTQTGCTFGSVTQIGSQADTSLANDLHSSSWYLECTAGSGSGAPASVGSSTGNETRLVGFFCITLVQGGGGGQSVTCTGISSTAAYGSHTVGLAQTVTPSGLATGAAFGTTTIALWSPRTNLDTNPALKNNATGWSGGTRVTGITGLSRSTGYESTGLDLQTSRVDVIPDDTYRVSVEVKGSGGASTGTCNINWYLGGSYVSSAPAQAWTVTNGGVTRLDSGPQVAPSMGVDSALLTVEGIDNVIQLTGVLFENTHFLGSFFDGDDGEWLGADGNSESMLSFGADDISPGGITGGQAFGTAVVSNKISATGIASGQAFGSTVITSGLTIAAFGIASGQGFGSHTLFMFPTLLQDRQQFIAAGALTISPSFPELLATAGNLIVFVLAGNRDLGTLTMTGTGWNHTVDLRHPRVSLAIVWKVAQGGESGVTASWTQGNDSGSQCWLGEYSSGDPGVWVVKGTASNNTSGVNVTGTSSGMTGTLVGAGVSVAGFAVENVLSNSVDSVSNSYVLRFTQGSGTFETGIWVADKGVPGGTTTETTLSRTSPVTADQMSGGLVVVGKAVPATLTPTGITSGEAFGTPAIFAIYPTGIVSAEAIGSHTVAVTTFNIHPTGIPTGEAIGTHVVHRGPLLRLTGIASAQAFGTAIVAHPARHLTVSGVLVSNVYFADTEVDAVYAGETRVWG